jgi:8-hydroxy-5-deazaflavin:NADPH oxidoreductase
MGFALSLQLGLADIPVVIGSRSLERALEAETRLKELAPKGDFKGLVNAEAVAGAKVVFITVPFRNQSETYTNLKNFLKPGQIVVDASVPLAATVSGKATRMLGIWQGSAAEQAEEMCPSGVGVVSALHTISAKTMRAGFEIEQDVLLCGNSTDEKATVSEILNRIPGLRCVDCGPLERSRLVEPISALLIGLNARYKAQTGLKIVGLPESPSQ